MGVETEQLQFIPEKDPRDKEGSSLQRYNGRNIPEPENCPFLGRAAVGCGALPG